MGVSKESRCGQIEVAIPGHLQAERRTMLRKGGAAQNLELR